MSRAIGESYPERVGGDARWRERLIAGTRVL